MTICERILTLDSITMTTDQSAFVKARGTMDAVHAARLLFERSSERQKSDEAFLQIELDQEIAHKVLAGEDKSMQPNMPEEAYLHKKAATTSPSDTSVF